MQLKSLDLSCVGYCHAAHCRLSVLGHLFSGISRSVMETITTLVLPGLDGTDLLLDRFGRLAPPTYDVTVLTLPDDPMAGYSELCDHFSETVASAGKCILVGESFSGPLAVLLAQRHPGVVNHLVLVATFVVSPVPFVARWIPWSLFFRFPLPSFAARRFMLGPCDDGLVGLLQRAVCTVSSRTLARRMRAVVEVDVSVQFRQLTCPVTCIWPTDDALVPGRCVTTMLELREDVISKPIVGPHLILQTQPEQAWKHIVDATNGVLSH